VRLFFAVWPPPQTAAALEQWARGCEGRVVPAANIHLTLAFLGEAEPAAALSAARRVQGRAHELPIEHARYWRHNRIIWAGPQETPAALSELVKNLGRELRAETFVLEERPFAAHVTLLRNAAPPKAPAPLPPLEWPVREFALVSSRGGAYRDIERFALSSPAG
jgi:2'-5' RNA ligase